MIFLEEMKDLKIYNRPFFLPTTEENDKTGSAILLLTPNYESSKNVMNLPYLINKRQSFRSYYMERNINYIINSSLTENSIDEQYYGDYLEETMSLSASERNELDNKDFGLPKKRKYPLHDAKHVKSAIKFFNYVDKEDEEELAKNIKKAMKKYHLNIDISDKNRLSKYINESYIQKDLFFNYAIESADKSELARNYKPKDDKKVVNESFESDEKLIRYFIDLQKGPEVLCESYTIESNNDIQFHNAFTYYHLEDEKKDNGCWDEELYSKDFESAIRNELSSYSRDTQNGKKTFYVYTMGKDYSSILLGAVTVFWYDYWDHADPQYDWEWDYQEDVDLEAVPDEVLKEDFTKRKDGIDSSYLTNHIKYFGKKGKHRSHKVKIGIEKFNKELKDLKNITNPDEKSNPIVDKNADIPTDTSSSVPDDTTTENFLYGINPDLYIQTEHAIMFLEDARYDQYLRKVFYNERIKQDKELLERYKIIKQENPFIKYSFVNITRYNSKNLYIDLSYYNQIFFKNNEYTLLKAVNLYMDLLKRLINDKKLSSVGYTRKTVFIPIKDWSENQTTRMWMYRDGVNPISVIFHMLQTNPNKVKELFKGMDVVFMDTNRYFKVNFDHVEDFKPFNLKFKNLITRIQKNQEVSEEDKDSVPMNIESKKTIVSNIVNKLEDSQGIKIKNLTGSDDTTTEKDVKKKIASDKTISSKEVIDSEKKTAEIIKDQEKKELLDSINKIADKAIDTNDAIEQLDDERIKALILDLASQEAENVKINNARASRMMELQKNMMNIKLSGKSVKDLLEEKPEETELVKTDLTKRITTTNTEAWEGLQYTNFNSSYDINADIVRMLNKLSTTSHPIAIRNIKVEDNSTSEDFLDLYTVEMEDYRGKRFSVKFDVPKFINDRFLLLRGNQKTIQNQLANMPIIKTDNDTCQVISNYSKIFVRRFGTMTGKSNPISSRIVKTLNKYDGKEMKIELGDCSRVSDKYELPIDYIDIGSAFSKIELPRVILYLNQNEIREVYKDSIDLTRGIPYGYNKETKEIIYFDGSTLFSIQLLDFLLYDNRFKELYDNSTASIRSTYSKCSILDAQIPLIIVCCFCEGLEMTLKKANINYELKEKITKEDRQIIDRDWIRFKDGYVVYQMNYSSILLMNGLKQSNTIDYSLTEINSKQMYTDFLDSFGGRLKADGLNNFYDCMIDPITESALEYYKLPIDYVSVLVYANNLLSDNKFIKHTNITAKRLRKKELIAVKVYKALFNDAYCSYANQLRHNKNVAMYTIRQTAVIDKFMSDPTASDNSIINAINDVETANEVTSKGESGMNADRAYSLDKRTFDDSMLNVLAMSTGFAGNVGITRQATIDSNISGDRGYIKSINNDLSKMNTTKTLSVTEALNPFGVTSDYPFRTAMTFIQTARHAMRTDISDPLLVTNGTDEAMPYLVSDTFAFKAKQDGVIKEIIENQYIIIQYNDGTKDYIDLKYEIKKNSDGGFFVPIELTLGNNIKLDKKIKAGDIIAYDKSSFSNSVGEDNNISYDVGTLSKIAVLNTDEGFEDSAIVTEKLCEQMGSDVIIKEDISLAKNTNIFDLPKIGSHVEEGDTMLLFQTPYEDDDMNILLKNLTNDKESISELGRKPIKSHVTGTVCGIKMYRTVEIEELSESLQKAFNAYEKPIKALKKKLDSEKIVASELPATYTLPATGKLKNCVDGVLIEIYVNVHDIMSVGDKIVFDRANKGVIKDIIPSELAPYTDFRPNEEISAFANVSSFNKRMVSSPLKIGALNKLLIELDRSVKDILQIPYDDSKI